MLSSLDLKGPELLFDFFFLTIPTVTGRVDDGSKQILNFFSSVSFPKDSFFFLMKLSNLGSLSFELPPLEKRTSEIQQGIKSSLKKGSHSTASKARDITFVTEPQEN